MNGSIKMLKYLDSVLNQTLSTTMENSGSKAGWM